MTRQKHHGQKYGGPDSTRQDRRLIGWNSRPLLNESDGA
jgi:hypothetical protein